MQASVAHDLRNPIAIMTGYVEYLQENNRGGTLTEEKLEKALSNLGITAERMGRYTDTMRDLGAIEETEVHRREVELPDFYSTWRILYLSCFRIPGCVFPVTSMCRRGGRS